MLRKNFFRYYPPVSAWDVALQKLGFARGHMQANLQANGYDLGQTTHDVGEGVKVYFTSFDLAGKVTSLSVEEYAIDRYDGGGTYITHKVGEEKKWVSISPAEEVNLPETVKSRILVLREARQSLREEKIKDEEKRRAEELRLARKEVRQVWEALDLSKISPRDREVLEKEAEKAFAQ